VSPDAVAELEVLVEHGAEGEWDGLVYVITEAWDWAGMEIP